MDPDGDYESLHSSRSIVGALLKEAKQDDANEFDGKGKDEEMGLKANYSTTVLSEEKAGSIDLKPSAPPAVDLGCLPSAPPLEQLSLHPSPEDDATAPPTPESNHPPEPPGFKEDVNDAGNYIPDSVALPIGLNNADRALPVASVVPIITDATGAEVAPTTEISPSTTNENIPTNQGTRDPARRVPSFFRQSSTHPAPLDDLPANHSAVATLADPQPPRAGRNKNEGQGSKCTPRKKIMAIGLVAAIIAGVAVGLTISSKPNEHNYPNCHVSHPEWIGDGFCNGGNLNTKQCGWDGGDCFERNWPGCHVSHSEWIGDGFCNGGQYNTAECGWDGEDCIVEGYPDCHSVQKPHWIGDGVCDGDKYNTRECGWDGGDCGVEGYPECQVTNPNKIGDGRCDGGQYNTENCGWDGGDCIVPGWPACHVDNPDGLGNGQCNKGSKADTVECGFDLGDCKYGADINKLKTILNDYPGCYFEDMIVTWIGDGTCDYDEYNKEECGWDGGDCVVEGYPDCHVDSSILGDGSCDSAPNIAECGYDDGDCQNFNRMYPNCRYDDPSFIGDSICDSDADVAECGGDGGDCAEFRRRYPNCNPEYIHWINDGTCDEGDEYNNSACGWDGGDCLFNEYIDKACSGVIRSSHSGKTLGWCQYKCLDQGNRCKAFDFDWNTHKCRIFSSYSSKTNKDNSYCYKKK